MVPVAASGELEPEARICLRRRVVCGTLNIRQPRVVLGDGGDRVLIEESRDRLHHGVRPFPVAEIAQLFGEIRLALTCKPWESRAGRTFSVRTVALRAWRNVTLTAGSERSTIDLLRKGRAWREPEQDQREQYGAECRSDV